MKKPGGKNPNKEQYQRLRLLAWDELWKTEVPRFDAGSPEERLANVSLIRAIGVVFIESGDPAAKADVARWLRGLLRDPEEKIRRYAMAALPKIGVGTAEESELLGLFQATDSERERKFLSRSLDKIGGSATLEVLRSAPDLLPMRDQRVRANIARLESPGAIALERPLPDFEGVAIHLRCRHGLEDIVREEALELAGFRCPGTSPGLVRLTPLAAFSLSDLYALRCFGTLGVVLGTVDRGQPSVAEALARTIASPLARRLLSAWTDGPIRYRLEFVDRGHQRALVKDVAARAYAECPEILNDSRQATWSVDIHPAGKFLSVELRPRLVPDPRFSYRRQDVPAASHPPLAACMARLSASAHHVGPVWDPFCGSGLELIECARLGGVAQVLGSDRSPEAIAIAGDNFSSAGLAIPATFHCCDFRDFAREAGIRPGGLAKILTNPPLGRRVRIANLPGLIRDLFAEANDLLCSGGSLVFVNPVDLASPFPDLRLKSSRRIDLGGFDGQLEHYIRQ